MKKGLFAAIILALGFSSCGPSYVTVQNPPPQPPPQEQQPEEVSYQTFYDDLSPYGQWIDYPGYGYVWMPQAGPDFKPYSTNGHWVYSDAGWVWASDYNWGWATFHYGRWFFEQNYGWMWVPGNEWAPAWVSWRRSPDYYGWAPLGPNIGVGVSISTYNPPSNYWCFVPHQYINRPNVNNYYVNETRNVTIINNTTVINNTVINNNVTNNRINNTTINNNTRNNVFVAGPDANEVSRATGNTVRPVTVTTSNRPGQTQESNGQLRLFRPRVNDSPRPPLNAGGNNNQQRVAPARVQSFSNLRPTVTNNTNNNEPARTEPNRNNAVTPANTNNNNNNSSNTRPPVSTEPVNRPVTPPVNNNVQPAPVQTERPVTRPNNDQQQVTRPSNNLPPANNNQNQQATPPVNNPGRRRAFNNPPANNNTTQPQPGANQPTNSFNANGNRPAQQQNRVNPRPPVQQAQRKPPLVKKDDKKDKPKPDHQ